MPCRKRSLGRILLLTAFICLLTQASVWAAANVSNQVTVSNSGFGKNRANNKWSAMLKVKNISNIAVSGPIQVVLTNLAAIGIVQSILVHRKDLMF